MESMRVRRLNSPGGLLGCVPGEPQEKRDHALQYNCEAVTSGLPAPVYNSENMLTTHLSEPVYQTHASDNVASKSVVETWATETSETDAIASKQDSSPRSPGDMEMPTLVPQVPLDGDEDVFSSPSMPDLKNSIAMNNPPASSYPDLCELPMQSLEGQTVQADSGSLEATCMRSTLMVVVDRSPDNFSEPSPGTHDFMSETPVDGSPVDDRQPCRGNPMPPCKGQVLNTEHSPGYSHRDNFDVSSLEGEVSRPMQSPEDPRSVGSECLLGTVQAADVYTRSEDDPNSEEFSAMQFFETGQVNEHLEVFDIHPQVAALVNSQPLQYGFGDGQLDFDDLPQLTSMLDGCSTPNDCAQDDSCCEELPELIPEKADAAIGSPEGLNDVPLATSLVPAPSQDVRGRPKQKIPQNRVSTSPRKTRSAQGKKRKSYSEFYPDESDHASDESDETFSPRGPPRKKKRGPSKRRRRGSQTQAARSKACNQVSFEKHEDSELQFVQQTLAFDKVETKLSRVLPKIWRGCTGLGPGSVRFYRVLCELSDQSGLSRDFGRLSIEENANVKLRPVVVVEKSSNGRVNLLCAAVARILEQIDLTGIAQYIRRSGDVDSKLKELDCLLGGVIQINGW